MPPCQHVSISPAHGNSLIELILGCRIGGRSASAGIQVLKIGPADAEPPAMVELFEELTLTAPGARNGQDKDWLLESRE